MARGRHQVWRQTAGACSRAGLQMEELRGAARPGAQTGHGNWQEGTPGSDTRGRSFLWFLQKRRFSGLA